MANKQVTVVAQLKAKPGLEQRLKAELLAMLAPSRKDPGCINYDLHVAPDHPGKFMFHENWQSKQHLDDHLATPHLKAFFAKAGELLAEPAQIALWKKLG